jgi:hypothetical protein
MPVRGNITTTVDPLKKHCSVQFGSSRLEIKLMRSDGLDLTFGRLHN